MPLEPTARFGSVEVTLAPALKAIGMTEEALLRPVLTLFLVQELTDDGHGTIFRVRSGDEYNLHLSIQRGRRVVLWRNGLACFAEAGRPGKVIITPVWTPLSLELFLTSEGRPTGSAGTVHTPPTGLPNFLPRWLRERALLPQERYKDAETFLEEVVVQLEHLGSKLQKTAAVDFGYDNQRDGQKIVERLPKFEPSLTRSVELLLHDIEYTKHISVYHQADAGPGRMDFLFTGTLESGAPVKVCAEFKMAHADDLLDGITKQLPAYMDNKDTDYGIFGAFDFGIPMVAKPEGVDPGVARLEVVLAAYARRMYPQRKVRSVVLPMVKPPNPSAL